MTRIALTILFALIIVSSFGCAFSSQKIEQWEYKQVEIDYFQNKNLLHLLRDENLKQTADDLDKEYHEKLNKLGAQGWELISVSANSKTHIFKRRL